MEFVKALADLLRAAAWPAVALTAIFLFRSHIRSMTDSLSVRIAEANKIKLKIGSVVLELAREIARPPAVSRKRADDGSDTREKFDEIAKQYVDLKIEDDAERAEKRRALVEELERLAQVVGVDRDALVKIGNEGAMVTVATLAIDDPQSGDIDLLEKISKKAKFNYTRYRIVLALLPFLEKNLSDAKMLDKAEVILRNVERADRVSPSLQRLIDKTGAVVSSLRAGIAVKG